MKVTLERAQLLNSLNHIHRVVERRSTIPILSNVLIKAEGDSLHFRATDLDIELIDQSDALVEEAGETTVPALTLYEIARKLDDGAQVQLSTDVEGTKLKVVSGRSDFEIGILSANDFPSLAIDGVTHQFGLPASALARLIERTQFAMSSEETRYYLNGIYLHVVDGDTPLLRAVATDGHRLAQAQLAAPEGAQGMEGIIIPKKAVGELNRLLDGLEEDVAVELSDTKLRLSFGGLTMTTKLIDGTFPDYERVIPKQNDKVMKAEKALFAQAVDRVSTIASERGRAVKLAAADANLSLSVINPEAGSAQENLPVDYDSDDLEIGFNARYLLDIAAQIETDTAQFTFKDAGSPTLVTEEGESDALFVLMPMRV